MGGAVVGIVIYAFVALVMVSIGVANLRSKKPVGFYTGETLKEGDITDTAAWNRKHGIMWILYGVVMFGCFLAGVHIGSGSAFGMILMIGGTIAPIFLMIWYHQVLWMKYRRR